MEIKIGKKIQSKHTGSIATIKSKAVEGFVTLEYADGTKKDFAEYVLQNKWTDKIDKNFKPQIEERTTIQLGEKRKAVKSNPKKEVGFPFVMYTWVKYGRKRDALDRYKVLKEEEKKALKKYFKENDVKHKHLDFLKVLAK